MQPFASHVGAWSGPNAFRLMPSDAPHDAPMTAEISLAVAGQLAQIAYSWSHATDGEQQGLLVFGTGDETGAVTAFWGDSWHQHPAPRTLDGTTRNGVTTVGYNYSGAWRWEIVIDLANPELLTLTMNNVIPAAEATDELAAGAYAAMRAELRREATTSR